LDRSPHQIFFNTKNGKKKVKALQPAKSRLFLVIDKKRNL